MLELKPGDIVRKLRWKHATDCRNWDTDCPGGADCQGKEDNPQMPESYGVVLKTKGDVAKVRWQLRYERKGQKIQREDTNWWWLRRLDKVEVVPIAGSEVRVLSMAEYEQRRGDIDLEGCRYGCCDTHLWAAVQREAAIEEEQKV